MTDPHLGGEERRGEKQMARTIRDRGREERRAKEKAMVEKQDGITMALHSNGIARLGNLGFQQLPPEFQQWPWLWMGPHNGPGVGRHWKMVHGLRLGIHNGICKGQAVIW